MVELWTGKRRKKENLMEIKSNEKYLRESDKDQCQAMKTQIQVRGSMKNETQTRKQDTKKFIFKKSLE